jgi:hypothetical protein
MPRLQEPRNCIPLREADRRVRHFITCFACKIFTPTLTRSSSVHMHSKNRQHCFRCTHAHEPPKAKHTQHTNLYQKHHSQIDDGRTRQAPLHRAVGRILSPHAVVRTLSLPVAARLATCVKPLCAPPVCAPRILLSGAAHTDTSRKPASTTPRWIYSAARWHRRPIVTSHRHNTVIDMGGWEVSGTMGARAGSASRADQGAAPKRHAAPQLAESNRKGHTISWKLQ